MPSDLETYLQIVAEEDDMARAAQVHIPTLVAMLLVALRHLRVHDCVGLDELNRLAREAKEKQNA